MAKNNHSKKKNNGTESKKRSSGSLARTRQGGSDIARREPQFLGAPFTFVRRFSEEMDRLFEDFGVGRGLVAPSFDSSLERLGTVSTATWAPRDTVLALDHQLILRA